MFFHGTYFSNVTGWMSNSQHRKPSAQVTRDIIGQSILNADTGAYFQGLPSKGIISLSQLKSSAALVLVASQLALSAAYFHFHGSFALGLSTFALGPCPVIMSQHCSAWPRSRSQVISFTYHFQSPRYSTQTLTQQ